MISGSSFIVTNFDSYRRLTWLLTSPVKIIRGTRKLVQTPGINKKKNEFVNSGNFKVQSNNPLSHLSDEICKNLKFQHQKISCNLCGWKKLTAQKRTFKNLRIGKQYFKKNTCKGLNNIQIRV
jgi:hypothetical protein